MTAPGIVLHRLYARYPSLQPLYLASPPAQSTLANWAYMVLSPGIGAFLQKVLLISYSSEPRAVQESRFLKKKHMLSTRTSTTYVQEHELDCPRRPYSPACPIMHKDWMHMATKPRHVAAPGRINEHAWRRERADHQVFTMSFH
jgi:hypothetical protein